MMASSISVPPSLVSHNNKTGDLYVSIQSMKILVFDLGGGTLDVTIMDFGAGVIPTRLNIPRETLSAAIGLSPCTTWMVR